MKKNKIVKVLDLGFKPYAESLTIQEDYFNQIIDLKVFSNKCVSCSASIDENSFKVLNNKPYCIKCFNGYSYQFTSSNNESISNSSNNESISKKSGNGWWFMIYTFLGFFLLFSIINFREIGGVFTSSNQNDVQETNKSSYPAGVSSACFCMDALSGGNNYKPTAKQVTQCRTMYKCWGNAQADCYTGSSNVWTRCEN